MALFPVEENAKENMVKLVQEQLHQADPDYTPEKFVDDLWEITAGNGAVIVPVAPKIYELRRKYEGLRHDKHYSESAVRTQIAMNRLRILSPEEVKEWTGQDIRRPSFIRVTDLLVIPLTRWYHEIRAKEEREKRSIPAGRPRTRATVKRRSGPGRPPRKEFHVTES